MAINVAVEIGKRLFIWGVLAMVALPRQHIDRTAWSIGGGLSHSFRKLLAASVALNLCRLLAKLYGHARLLADLLGILQAVSLSFLCFLTPYVLQTWMVSQINIGGRPGSNLLPALYGNGVLSILGVVLCRLVHPNLWCIKRLGNIISAPPVLSTMAMYNSVTSVGGHHRGRGTIMAQTIVVAEYWYIITQSLCFLGLALDKHSGEDDYSSWDYCLKAFRNIAFVSDWTRVCVHGIFINLLDELYLSSAPSNSTERDSSPGTHDLSEEESDIMVSTKGAKSPRPKPHNGQDEGYGVLSPVASLSRRVVGGSAFDVEID
ncbi:expressed unknown protein [Seminavis robusta]|uniref:Uncharacterized protein n=1 Tax=Seminavis robusta TaxID=568900 RepID=A0A9N8I0B5_9STRA|nr:expressed unknown protein [Seminavis robusta]|eukprot:Sro3644_g349960.1 n/a (318) ;mRNA; r:4160-5113